MGKNENITSFTGEQALPGQHTTEEDPAQTEGIFVPLDLSELHILNQKRQADGTIRIEVIAKTTQAVCPSCQKRWLFRTSRADFAIHIRRKRRRELFSAVIECV